MTATVFYSWQSDLPNTSNRSFIENILDAVAKNMVDAEGKPMIVVDRDTKGVPGSPDISQAILSKIDVRQSKIPATTTKTPGEDSSNKA